MNTENELNTIAAFDFDGTLTTRDSLLPFFFFVAGPFKTLLRIALGLPALIAFQLGIKTRQEVKEFFLTRFFGGLSSVELHHLGEDFAKGYLQKMVLPHCMQQIKWHQERGHRCILVSASIETYLGPWARDAGFDDLICSQLKFDSLGNATGTLDGLNCWGPEKARRLTQLLGPKGTYRLYAYGDSRGDQELLALADYPYYKGKPCSKWEGTGMNNWRDLWRLMRPQQWTKSAFVFTGFIFSHAWDDFSMGFRVLLAAIAFSLVSSSVYIGNDILDRENDKRHPKKKNRPIASGKVTESFAIGLGCLLAVVGLALGLFASWRVCLILILYLMLNCVYSLRLKKIVILDVFCISAGFMLRILAGTVGIGIPPSKWLLLCGLMITLFLGFAKRRAEMIALSRHGEEFREVLIQYGPVDLDEMISICAGGVIISYSLYTMSPETIRIHQTENLIYTVPFVIYALFRYLYLLHHHKKGDEPSRDLFRDRHIITSFIGWAVVTLFIFMRYPGAI